MTDDLGKYHHRLGHIMIYCKQCDRTIKAEIHDPLSNGSQTANCEEGHFIRIDDLDPARFERFNP